LRRNQKKEPLALKIKNHNSKKILHKKERTLGTEHINLKNIISNNETIKIKMKKAA